MTCVLSGVSDSLITPVDDALCQPFCINNLRVQRGETVLCQPVGLTVSAGECVHVQGPNGTGKTTLLLMLAGVLPIEQGGLRWGSLSRGDWSLLYSGHQTAINAQLTVWQNMVWLASLAGSRSAPNELGQALEAVALGGYEDTLISQLSSGQKRRVALARLWLKSSLGQRLWLLDEPLVALDAPMISRFERRLLQYTQNGGRVILTSHQPLAMPVRSLVLEPAAEGGEYA